MKYSLSLKKLTHKYEKLSAPVKASLWFVVCGFLQKGIAMITTPVFTRIMTTTEFGRYTVYNTWLSIVQILISLNLAAGVYTRGLVENEEDADRFSSSMLGLSSTCILIGSVIYALLHEQINCLLNLSTILMTAMIVEVWSSTAFKFWAARERVNYRYKKLVALTLVYVSLRPALGIICVLNADVNAQVEARVLSTVLVCFAMFVFPYIGMMRKGGQFYNKEYWSYALRFNIPLVPHYLSQIVLNQSDRLMINSICGAAATAYYGVAYSLAFVLQVLNDSIAGTMNPWIYRSIRYHNEDKIGKVSYSILLLIAAVNFVLVAVAPEAMLILAPKSYQPALLAIPPVTSCVYFTFLYNLFATFEYYYKKTKYVTYVTVVSAVLNIILNAIFIPEFGFIAAGYTTLLCFILCSVAHYLFMCRVCDEFMDGKRIYNVKIIIGIGAAMLAAYMVMMFLYEMPLLRYTILLAVIAVGIIRRNSVIKTIKTIKEK